MARLNFFVDKRRCISCFSCQVACSSAHEIPVGVNRRKVITLNEGVEGKEISTTIACQHCEDAPCQQVCPVDCFYTRADGIVLHDKDKCIGCAYCLYACPFGAPQFDQTSVFGNKGVMDKCTMCAGGPLETNSEAERHKYGQNRIAEGKVPMCAAVCSTNALIVGESSQLQAIYAKRIENRENESIKNVSDVIEWQIAYEKKDRV